MILTRPWQNLANQKTVSVKTIFDSRKNNSAINIIRQPSIELCSVIYPPHKNVNVLLSWLKTRSSENQYTWTDDI